jgi:chondroitin-sulfate-ABC endolyase/exolyase
MATIVVVATLGCCALTPASESRPAQSAVETIPFSQMKQWLGFDRADLDGIQVENGQLDFSSRFSYEDEHSLRWKYASGGSLTWHCKLDKLGKTPTFYFAALEPQRQRKTPSSFRLEFLDANGGVACHAEFVLVYKFWNRCILRLTASPAGNGGRIEVGVKNLVGDIPAIISGFRLTPLSANPGELFLGGWLLTGQMLTVPSNIAEPNGFPELTQPDPATLPEPPSAEITSAEDVGQRLEKTVMADWLDALQPNYEGFVPNVMARYQALHLHRTPEGMTGRNLLMEGFRQNEALLEKFRLKRYDGLKKYGLTGHSWDTGGESYCLLMLDLAQCYRHESAPGRKAKFLEMYETLFDFSQYLNGFSSPWANGNGFVDSVFLMRKELFASKRLDKHLLSLLRRQVDFDRIYLDHSASNIDHPGDLGEDCDYTRITSERLIQLSLLESDPRIRIHYLHAFQRYFSRIVLAYSPGIRDTFKPDGSTNHHFGLTFGYGAGAIDTGARVISLLSKTPFAIEPAGHALFKKAMLMRRNFSRNAWEPLILSGKETLQGPNELRVWPYRLMALAGTPDGSQAIDREMAGVYLRLFAEKKAKPTAFDDAAMKLLTQEKIEPETVPQGHFTLGWSAAAVHRRADWLLCLRGYSRYAYSREAGHIGCDHFVQPHLGFGTLELLDQSNYNRSFRRTATEIGILHASDIASPGYDWTKFPSTTDVALPFEKIAWQGDWQHRSDQPFVGGVDAPDGTGAFVLSLHGPRKIGLESFFAHKSWFFFGDTLVCLGSGVRDTIADHETTTTLFQDAWGKPDAKGKPATPLFLNSAMSVDTFPLEKKELVAAPQWLINRQSLGFYLYPGQQLCLRRGEQKSPASYNKNQTAGKFTTAWLSHGNAPQNASYRYLMRVGSTPEVMVALSESMSRNAPYEIRQQDDTAHIVASKPDATAGYVIFKADATLSGNEVASVSRPCVITTHRPGADMVLSIADPDLNFIDKDKAPTQWGYSQPSTIIITLHGRWKTDNSAAAIAYLKPGDTEITIRCKDGLTSSITLMPVPN